MFDFYIEDSLPACRTKSREPSTSDISLSPLKTAQGYLIMAIVRDITKQRKSEEFLICTPMLGDKEEIDRVAEKIIKACQQTVKYKQYQ